MHVRCPNCSNPIALSGDEFFADLECPSCGSHFQLISDETVTAEEISRSLAHFELLHQVGMGRFGSVWKARDTVLDRIVAIKIPRQEVLDAQSEDQFFREARAAAQLKHPHIVSVHEVGREGDTIYIACDYIDGVDLSGWLRGSRLTAREAAVLCATIADALQHAHESGVIHRDLKPSNILVDRDGKPYLADFGLAKRESGEITITLDGKLLGTPAYMSPEQARGEAHLADRRSDIYSLGVVLYELLTGQRPFRGDRRMLIMQILHEDPLPPRRFNSHVPRDLETICLKCLEKEPSARYQSAEELADDLQRYLAGEPVLARRVGTVGRTIRWARRNRAVAGLLLAIMAILLTATAVSTFFAWQSGEEAARATDNLYDSLVQEIRSTRVARQQGYGETVRDLIERALALGTSRVNRDELRREMVQAMGDFVAYPPQLLDGFPGEITATRMNAGMKELAVGLKDGRVILCPPTTDGPRTQLEPLEGEITAIAFSKEGDRLVAADRAGKARVWRRAGDQWKTERTFSMAEAPYAVLASEAGEYLAVVKDSLLEIWDVSNGSKHLRCPTEPTWQMRNAAFDVLNRRVAAGYLDEEADRVGWVLYDLDDASKIHEVQMPTLGNTYSNGIAVGNEGRQLAIGFDEAMLLYDLNDFQQTSIYRHDSTKAVAFHPSNRFVAAINIRGSVILWNGLTNRLVAALNHPKQQPSRESLSFNPEGTHLVVSNSHSIRIWDLTAANEKTMLVGHQGGTPCALFHPQQNLLLTGGKDDHLHIWDTETGDLQRSLKLGEELQTLSLTPDNRLLAIGCMGRAGAPHLRLVDMESLDVVLESRPSMVQVHSLSFFKSDLRGSEALYLAGCGRHGVALWRVQRLHDGEVPRLVSEMEIERYYCLATAVSSDGRWMVWVENERHLHVWDVVNRREKVLRAPPLNQGWHGVAFFPDSDRIIYISEAGSAEIWSVEQDEHVDAIGDPGTFNAPHIALSRDGRWLAALPDSDTVAVWDTATKEHLFSLPAEGISVWSLAWNSDRSQLAVGRSDGSLAIWHIPRIREKLRELGLEWGGK